MRRFELKWLDADGQIRDGRQIAPALPLFEDAASAFARGTLLDTDNGPMAIEDLLPGDRVITADNEALPVTWIGSTTVVPGHSRPDIRPMTLTRIMEGSFGMARPMSYLIAGPAARLMCTPAHLRAVTGGQPVLTPVSEFHDGVNVIRTAPPTAVQLYHLCLPRHAVIKLSGLEFETYHPGLRTLRSLSQTMRTMLHCLFPHMVSLSEFGETALPRAGDGQFDDISAA
jgi:hypothetical protein